MLSSIIQAELTPAQSRAFKALQDTLARQGLGATESEVLLRAIEAACGEYGVPPPRAVPSPRTAAWPATRSRTASALAR